MSTKRTILFVWILLFTISCAHYSKQIRRDISSEPSPYILAEDVVLRRAKDLNVLPPKEGQCFSDPESKVYLSVLKNSNTGVFKDLKSQIDLTQLENNENEDYYFCRISCKLDNRYASFWSKLSESPSRHNDANGFICQGITIEMINIPGTTLSALGPVVHLISIFDVKDILTRLKETNYKLSANTKLELNNKMYDNFKLISKAYLESSMPAMVEAGKILDLIAYQRSGNQVFLNYYLNILKENKTTSISNFSKDYFVLLNISQFSTHLLYEII